MFKVIYDSKKEEYKIVLSWNPNRRHQSTEYSGTLRECKAWLEENS